MKFIQLINYKIDKISRLITKLCQFIMLLNVKMSTNNIDILIFIDLNEQDKFHAELN